MSTVSSNTNPYVISHPVNDANPGQTAIDKGINRNHLHQAMNNVSKNIVAGGGTGTSSKSKMKKSKKSKKSKMSKRMSRMFDEPIVSRVEQRQRKWEKINRDAALNPFGFTDILKTEGGLKASSRRRFSRKFRKSLSRFRLSLRKSVLGRRRNKNKNKKLSRGGAAGTLTIPSFSQPSPTGTSIINDLASKNAQTVAYSEFDSHVQLPPAPAPVSK